MYEYLGIDLGASRITVGSADAGIIASESLPIPILEGGDSPLEIGKDVGQRIADGSGKATRCRVIGEAPLVSETTSGIIQKMLSTYGDTETGGSCVLFGIPCRFSEMEENALTEMAVAAGAKEAYLVYSPLAAMVGNDLDPGMGAVIVDIGAVRTDILIVCHGRIFCKKTIPVGGASFDCAIAEHVLKKHKVTIAPDVAETVKMKVGTVWVGNEHRTAEARGRDISNGDYCTAHISSDEMFTALEEPMALLMEGICDAITKIPPDYVREVFDTGVLLSGGGCLLEGIDRMISGVTGINTFRLNDPANTTVRGLAILAARASALGANGTRNISRYIMKAAAEPQGGEV